MPSFISNIPILKNIPFLNATLAQNKNSASNVPSYPNVFDNYISKAEAIRDKDKQELTTKRATLIDLKKEKAKVIAVIAGTVVVGLIAVAAIVALCTFNIFLSPLLFGMAIQAAIATGVVSQAVALSIIFGIEIGMLVSLGASVCLGFLCVDQYHWYKYASNRRNEEIRKLQPQTNRLVDMQQLILKLKFLNQDKLTLPSEMKMEIARHVMGDFDKEIQQKLNPPKQVLIPVINIPIPARAVS